MEVCSTGGGSEFYVQDFLKPVKTAKDAGSGNLALPVLAVQSGGRTLDSGNGGQMDKQIQNCLADAAPFYSLSFDPPNTKPPGGYHALKIQIDKPGLTARTNTGYYGEP